MTTDVTVLYRRALDGFGAKVRAIRDDSWRLPTPCTDWDVHALVNHLVGENRWAPPLFDGKTIADVGDQFDGDLLGADPVAAWEDSAGAAVAALSDPGATDRTVHLSFGEAPGSEYAYQLFADALVHSWDLARAIGVDDRLDPELVDACAQWFAQHEETYRSAGAIGPRPELSADADAQTRLLAAFGRTTGVGGDRLRVIRGDQLSPDTAQTAGMRRAAAVSGAVVGAQSLWMGRTTVAPASTTGNHHHGESETAIYVVSGNPVFVFRDPGSAEEVRLETAPGDFVWVPPYVPHREENPSSDTEAVVVIARSTQEAIVVSVDELSI
jgi:uncharacterized protein (TIGR03086 family)